MARRVITSYVDDLDGSDNDVKTVSFTYNRTQYDIELGAKNRAAFDAVMAPYLRVARRRRNSPNPAGKLAYGMAAKIRAWAEETDHPGFSGPTGRLPDQVIKDYVLAHEGARIYR